MSIIPIDPKPPTLLQREPMLIPGAILIALPYIADALGFIPGAGPILKPIISGATAALLFVLRSQVSPAWKVPAELEPKGK